MAAERDHRSIPAALPLVVIVAGRRDLQGCVSAGVGYAPTGEAQDYAWEMTSANNRVVRELTGYRAEHGDGLHLEPSGSFLKWLVVIQGSPRNWGSRTIVVTTNQSPPPGSSNTS